MEVKSLGPVPVKGMSAPTEVYELHGASAVRTRLQAARAAPRLAAAIEPTDTRAMPRQPTTASKPRELFGAGMAAAVYFGLAASYFTEVRLVGVVGEDFPDQHVELLA